MTLGTRAVHAACMLLLAVVGVSRAQSCADGQVHLEADQNTTCSPVAQALNNLGQCEAHYVDLLAAANHASTLAPLPGGFYSFTGPQLAICDPMHLTSTQAWPGFSRQQPRWRWPRTSRWPLCCSRRPARPAICSPSHPAPARRALACTRRASPAHPSSTGSRTRPTRLARDLPARSTTASSTL